jgi:hypothetical protein
MSSSSSQPSKNEPVPQNSNNNNNNNMFSMIVVLGMVGAAAGFTMYTKRAGTMLKQMEQISKNKARRMPPPRVGPKTKEEWDKIRTRFDKDDF